jgi:hypothetical protein
MLRHFHRVNSTSRKRKRQSSRARANSLERGSTTIILLVARPPLEKHHHDTPVQTAAQDFPCNWCTSRWPNRPHFFGRPGSPCERCARNYPWLLPEGAP